MLRLVHGGLFLRWGVELPAGRKDTVTLGHVGMWPFFGAATSRQWHVILVIFNDYEVSIAGCSGLLGGALRFNLL
jgi:hypothetical protein